MMMMICTLISRYKVEKKKINFKKKMLAMLMKECQILFAILCVLAQHFHLL